MLQSKMVDCGEHTVTITELSDAYGAIKEAPEESDDEVLDLEAADEDGLFGEEKMMAGGSESDKRKVFTNRMIIATI